MGDLMWDFWNYKVYLEKLPIKIYKTGDGQGTGSVSELAIVAVSFLLKCICTLYLFFWPRNLLIFILWLWSQASQVLLLTATLWSQEPEKVWRWEDHWKEIVPSSTHPLIIGGSATRGLRECVRHLNNTFINWQHYSATNANTNSCYY